VGAFTVRRSDFIKTPYNKAWVWLFRHTHWKPALTAIFGDDNFKVITLVFRGVMTGWQDRFSGAVPGMVIAFLHTPYKGEDRCIRKKLSKMK